MSQGFSDLTNTAVEAPTEQGRRTGSARAKILRNVIFNWSGVVVGMATGLITVPVLIGRLGDAAYGLWIIIGALTGYFYFLDFGLRGAIGRHVAYYDAKNDVAAVNRTISTALVLLCGAAFLTIAGGTILAYAFHNVIKDVPADRIVEVRHAILIVAVSLSLFFFWRAFDAFLWGLQRFDLLNLVDIPTTLTRLGLTVLLVKSTGGLVTLAWITLGTTTVSGLAKTWLSFRERPALKIRPGFFAPSQVRELLAFGIWQFVESMANLSCKSFVPAAIGATLGAVAVVPFSLAMRLVEVASQFEMTATGVVAPISTVLHARENLSVQRKLFLTGTQYCSCLSFLFAAGFVLLGRETLTLWVGPQFAYASRYLTILALGSLLPIAFGVADSILIGLSRPGVSAVIAVCSAVISIAATVIFGRQGNLTNVCLTIAASTTLFHGILKPIVAGYLIGVSPVTFLTQAVLPAVAVSSIPIAFLYGAVTFHAPNSVPWLAGEAAVYGMLAVISVGLGVNGSAAALRKCFVPAG